MIKRVIIALGALGALAALTLSAVTWAPAGDASAHGGGDEPKKDKKHGGGYGDKVRWGDWWLLPGLFEAEGEGIAAGAGKLNLRLCAEEGLLLVKKGDSEIAVDAYEDSIEWLGLEVYFGFHGCAEIGGWGVAALVVGSGLQMRAEGIGLAYLAGEGTWSKNEAENGEWTADGRIYKIGTKSKHDKTPTPEPTDEPDPEPTEEPDPEPTATATPGEP
jgi:hypothetical protein